MFSNEDTQLLWEHACELGKQLRKGNLGLDWWARASIKQGNDEPSIRFSEFTPVGYKRCYYLKFSKDGDFLDFHGAAGQKVFTLAIAPVEEMADAFAKVLRLGDRFSDVPPLIRKLDEDRAPELQL